jgi:ketosteroid isomerase-like protein
MRKYTAIIMMVIVSAFVWGPASVNSQAELVTRNIPLKAAVRFGLNGKKNPELFYLARRLLSRIGALEVSREYGFTITDVKENVAAIERLCEVYHDPAEKSDLGNKGSSEDKTAIRAVLDAQAAAWNRGDVEGYMDGYDRSTNTEFVGGDSITRGWQDVFDRYKKKYDTREKMGTLTFTDLEINILSSDAALVLGRWRLKRANDEPHGTFTLLFRKTKAGWRIVHDHSSTA